MIGVSSIATPDDELTVCTTLPDGSINNNRIGTLALDSAATEIACVPAGSAMLRSTSCPGDCVTVDSDVVPGPVAGDPVAVALPIADPIQGRASRTDCSAAGISGVGQRKQK